jgi:hypothetical protein
MTETGRVLTMGEEDQGSVSSEVHGEVAQDGKYKWYRGVFAQATIVGCCAFAAPGLWNAMQSVGAGGAQTPYLVMSVLRSPRSVVQLTDKYLGQATQFFSL